MKDLKIGVRLGLGFGLTIVLMLVIAVIGMTQLAGVNRMTEHLTTNVYPKADAARRIELYDTDRGRLARTIILAPDDASKAAAKVSFDKDAARIDEQLARLDRLVDTDKGRGLVGTLKSAHAENARILDDIVALALQNKTQEATALLLGERNKASRDAYVAATGAMTDFQDQVAQDAAAQAGDVYTEARILVAAIALVAVLAGIAFAWFVTRSITSPLQIATEASGRVAAGDLSMPIDHCSRDEVGQLLATLERMRQSLEKTVGAVRSDAESVSVASGQIASGNTDLSARTEEQAASLEETAASMVELTETVKQNADNARQANTLATNASNTADAGNDTVQAMVETIGNISQSSVRISDITGLIEGIAFQTNILALNAAVEAARAGEQGRGFAVVASEVRSLAQRSAAAAKEIKELIGSSVAMIRDGSKQAEAVSATMADIKRAIRQVSDIVGEIAAASEEQSRGIEQVNQAVGQMDEVTQQNAALVEQAAAAAQSLQEQAVRLKEAVYVFKVADTGQPASRMAISQGKPPLPATRTPDRRAEGSVAIAEAGMLRDLTA